jgi:hypothetical protein
MERFVFMDCLDYKTLPFGGVFHEANFYKLYDHIFVYE